MPPPNACSRYQRWPLFTPRRRQAETARSRAPTATAKPTAPTRTRKIVQKPIPARQMRRGRADRHDAANPTPVGDIRTRLRAGRRALDSRGAGGTGDDLFDLSVQFG